MGSRFGIFAVFSFFLSFLFFKVVADEAGGSTDDDIGDFEIEDDAPDVDPKVETSAPDEKKEPSEMEKEVEELQAWKAEQEAQMATREAISELTEKYPNFDAEKIASHLATLAKDKGEAYAESFNNPLGWENIHLTTFNDSTDAHAMFDRGRGEVKEEFNAEEAMKKAVTGDKNAIAELLENSKG